MAESTSPCSDSRIPTILGVVGVLTGLSTCFTAARIFTRHHLLRSIGWDDGVIVFSLLLQIVNYIVMGIATKYGVGRHAHCLSPKDLLLAAKWNFTADPFGIMAVVVPKLAVVSLLSQLAGGLKKKSISFLWFCVISNILLSIIAAILLFAQCNPPSSLWNIAIPHTCWRPKIVADYSMFCGAWSAFNDLILALYPTTMIYNLKMRLGKKIALCGLLGLGVFAFCCSVIRTQKLAALENYSDVTWGLSETLIWAGAEANVIIICACIPTLVPLVQQVTGRRDYIFERTRGTSQRTLRGEVSLRNMNTTNGTERENGSDSGLKPFDQASESRSAKGSASRETGADKWQPV